MPRTPVVRDPAHPDFPHGQITGFGRGCTNHDDCPASPSCREARRRRERQTEYLRAQGKRIRGTPPGMKDRAIAHLDAVVALAPGATRSSTLEALGLSDATLGANRVGKQALGRILQATPDDARRGAMLAPPEHTAHLVTCLQAQGYSVRYLEQQAGVGEGTLTRLVSSLNPASKAKRRQTLVRRSTAEAVQRLAESIGNAPATPRPGLPQTAISLTRTAALARGYWPLAAYDDDGTLNLRRMPGHPWAEADDDAGRLLEAARELVGPDPTPARIAEKCGLDCRRVERMRGPLGLQFDLVEVDLYVRALRLKPDSQARADELRDLLDQAEDDPTVDRAALAQELGIIRLPHDHPLAVEVKQKRAPERRAAALARERARYARRRAEKEADRLAADLPTEKPWDLAA